MLESETHENLKLIKNEFLGAPKRSCFFINCVEWPVMLQAGEGRDVHFIGVYTPPSLMFLFSFE